MTVDNLSGENGVIKMDIDASQNSLNSDKLYVTDTLTGTQYIDLYEVNGYTPVGEEGVGTVLATVNNHNGSFAAVDGEGTLYWKRYELDHQDTADTSGNYTKDWYLKQVTNIDQPTTSTDTILAANALNYHTWRTENDKLLQRMGELRHNGEEAQGAWFRLRGTKIGRDGKFDFENKYTSYELGYDTITKNTDDKIRYQGAAVSYVDGDSSYNRGSGDNSSKAISFYNTEIGSKGHYLDVVFKVSNLENDFKVYDTKNNKITGDFNNTGVSLSAEYGRKNVLHNGWYIEPQAQFTLGYLGGDSLCIRVENIFAFIKYQPFFRIVRAIQAVSIFEFVYLQAENNHGKDIPDPIVFRKRNTDERPEGFSVEKHKLTGCGVVRGKSEINAAGQGRSAVNLIKSGPDFISPDIIQGL